MKYILDRPMLRDTPEVTEDDRVKWCPRTNRYWLKLKLHGSRAPNVCCVLGCENPVKSDSQEAKCNSCRKHVSVMNNPVLRHLQNMRSTANVSKVELDVTADDLYDMLDMSGYRKEFLRSPYDFRFRRKDLSKGFTRKNLEIEHNLTF